MKSKFFVNILIILILIFAVRGIEEGGEFGDEPTPPPSDDSSTFNSENPEPYYENQESDLGAIPSGNLDMGLVDRYDRYDDLTADQLVYGYPPRIDSLDLDRLDPFARDEALARLAWQSTGIPTTVSTDTCQRPSRVTTYGDGFGFDDICGVQVGNIFVANGKDVQYRGGKIFVGEADSVIFGTNIVTDVHNLEGKAEEFKVESAGMVDVECVHASGVKTTNFKVNGGVTLEPYQGVDYPVDIGTSGIGFQASPPGKMNVDCTTPPKIVLTNSVVNITTGSINERIEANNTIEFTSGAYGVECMEMSPLATYYYTDNAHIEKDFSAKVDKYDYRLCIRKHMSQNVNGISCAQCGIVDLAAHAIKLNGILNYRRYMFRQASNMYPLLDLTQRNVYLPENNASLFFEYDADNRFLPAEKIAANTPPIASYISNYLVLHELNTGDGTHTFAQINVEIDQTQLSQNLISSYECSYDRGKARIINNAFEEDNIFILPPGHGMIREMTK